MPFRLTKAEIAILRLLRRFHLGFEATGFATLASGRKKRGPFPLCPMKAVPDIFIAAELGREFRDWEIQLRKLVDEGGLVEPKRGVQKPMPRPKGQHWIPLEYTADDGARIRIEDPPYCRMVEVYPRGQSEPDLPYSIKNRRYALTPAGWVWLREQEERDRQRRRRKGVSGRWTREVPTPRQQEAYALYLRGHSYAAIGESLGITNQAVGKLVNQAKAIMEHKSRSVKTRRLPSDRRGQESVGG